MRFIIERRRVVVERFEVVDLSAGEAERAVLRWEPSVQETYPVERLNVEIEEQSLRVVGRHQ